MKVTSLSLIVLGVVIGCALSGSALATDKQSASCLDNNSPDKTISRCTEVINRRDQQSPAAVAAAYTNRGNAYLFIGKVDNAIADFTQAIRLKPDADLYTSRGAAYYQKGDVDRAKADWAEAKRLKDSSKPPSNRFRSDA